MSNLKFLQTRFYDASDDDEDTLIVPQRLSTEQYRFEFPSKSYLESLSYLDNIQDEYSFFDESSFTTSLTAYSPANTFENTQINSSHMVSDWHEMVDDDDELVDDGRLSPLQLPAQANPKTRIHSTDCKKRELSGESARTITQSERPVGPSSFLSDLHSNSNNMYSPVTQAYRLKSNVNYICYFFF